MYHFLSLFHSWYHITSMILVASVCFPFLEFIAFFIDYYYSIFFFWRFLYVHILTEVKWLIMKTTCYECEKKFLLTALREIFILCDWCLKYGNLQSWRNAGQSWKLVSYVCQFLSWNSRLNGCNKKLRSNGHKIYWLWRFNFLVHPYEKI